MVTFGADYTALRAVQVALDSSVGAAQSNCVRPPFGPDVLSTGKRQHAQAVWCSPSIHNGRCVLRTLISRGFHRKPKKNINVTRHDVSRGNVGNRLPRLDYCRYDHGRPYPRSPRSPETCARLRV